MQFQKSKEKILIVDFGSQVTKLIARRVRDLGAYSEVLTPNKIKDIRNYMKKSLFIWRTIICYKKIFKAI